LAQFDKVRDFVNHIAEHGREEAESMKNLRRTVRLWFCYRDTSQVLTQRSLISRN
jgi:hypothetical protein